MRLSNKVALITGGAAGIGLATARLFLAEGAKVMLVDVAESALESAVVTLESPNLASCAADVSDPAATARYVAAARERFGRIDVFFANAGIEGAVKSIVDYDLATFDRVMSVNVRGVWLGLKEVIPLMSATGGGSIVLTSSLGGLRGMPKMSAYIAAKHAVVGLMKCAALECAPLGIRVNCINPSPIDTRMIGSIADQWGGDPTRMRARFEAGVPLRRYGTPQEVAQLALFLASDESSYCTGTAFPIDGGMSAA